MGAILCPYCGQSRGVGKRSDGTEPPGTERLEACPHCGDDEQVIPTGIAVDPEYAYVSKVQLITWFNSLCLPFDWREHMERYAPEVAKAFNGEGW